jgi:integrase
MTLYVEELALDELQGLSAAQVESWRKVKFITVDMYEEVVGKGTALLDTTRADATKFHAHFLKRIKSEGISGNTANRRFGNVRKLFRVYANHLQLDVKNPFDGLSFSDPKRLRAVVPPFEPDYLERMWLKGSPFAKLNEQARLILLAMIETGCRPSEIANLKPENIRLKAKVPHLVITYMEDRGLKTENSVRTVPLVGVSLEAMKLAPAGFPRYRDKETNLSAALMAFLKENHMFPTKKHRVYSVRHTYEKRMLEAGFDDEFRRRMLGHDTERPDYGDGGSLEWRRDRMTAIALKYQASVLEGKG